MTATVKQHPVNGMYLAAIHYADGEVEAYTALTMNEIFVWAKARGVTNIEVRG